MNLKLSGLNYFWCAILNAKEIIHIISYHISYPSKGKDMT